MTDNRDGPHQVVVNEDIDDCAMLLEEDEDQILELSLDSRRLDLLRRFVAFERLPSQIFTTSKKRWNALFQLFIVVFVFCHYLYTLGAFKNKTLEEQEMGLTLNFFKIIVWNARHLLYAVFNLFYFTSSHIDDFDRSLKLTARSLKKAKRRLKIWYTTLVVFSIFVPALIRFCEMWITPKADTNKEFTAGEAIGNAVFTIAARLLALPIIIVFTVVFAFLYFEVKQFKKHIQTWPLADRAEARNFLVDILLKCKNAERGFQPFLIVHITILVLVFIPGVMSFVERAQYEGQMTYTFHQTPFQSLTYHADKTGKLLGAESIVFKNISRPIIVVNMPLNVTSGHKTVSDSEALMRIGLQSLAFLAELLSLYLPLILLGKINKVIKRIAETVQCLKFEEQQEGGYLFQSRVELDEMLKDLSNAHGVHILGMEITIIKTWLLAVMMPLFTLVLHIIFKHVDLAA